MLAFIESLVVGLAGAFLEILFEGIIYGLSYLLSGVVSKRIKSAGDKAGTSSDEANKPSVTHVGIIFLLILSGILAGSLVSLIFPERIFNFSSITGISLLITPIIFGLISITLSRWEKKHDWGTGPMANFVGGAIFGLAVAATRLIFITQIQST